MAIEILENNAIDINNIDGATFNNFASGNRSGIIGGWANECILSSQGNAVIMSTGFLLLQGIRVKITEVESVVIPSTPTSDTRYQLIAQLLRASSEPVFAWSLFAQPVQNIITDDIRNEAGIYQLEVGRFTHTTLGTITDVVRTADVLYGGASITADIDVGDVTTDILAPGIDAEIDINKRVEDKKTLLDFHFSLPATAGTSVLVNDIEQDSVSFSSDPQEQLNNKVDKDGAEMTKLAGIETGAQVNTLTGVKGSAESSYRTGNVNITAANIGLGSVSIDKVDHSITGPLLNLSITASGGVRRVYGRNVSGNISGTAELYLVNCTGSVTVSGNTAKLYTSNCPNLSISGKTATNWRNVYVDGTAEFVFYSGSRLLNSDDVAIGATPSIAAGDYVEVSANYTTSAEISTQFRFRDGQESYPFIMPYVGYSIATQGSYYKFDIRIGATVRFTYPTYQQFLATPASVYNEIYISRIAFYNYLGR